MVSESTVSNTELGEFFDPQLVLGRELSEFLSAYYLCAKTNSPRLSQNSRSLAQNSSESSLVRNSALETVFRPFPREDSYPTVPQGHKHRVTTLGNFKIPQNPADGVQINSVKIKPVRCISAFSALWCPEFPRFLGFAPWNLLRPLFAGVTGTFRIFHIFPYRVRIADFEDPTDRLYCDRA